MTAPGPGAAGPALPARLLLTTGALYLATVLALTMGPHLPGNLEVPGNVVLLMPLGFLIALGWPRKPPIVATAVGFLLSCAIESVQLLALSHRFPELKDILLNTSGTALGAVLGLAAADLLQRRRAGRAEPVTTGPPPGHSRPFGP